MKTISLKLLALAAVVSAAPLAAQSPIQISLFNPAQIVGEGSAVEGLRLNILYAKNTNVSFIDLGFGYNLTTGNGMGIQWALVPHTKGNFSGIQGGLVAITQGTMTGVQWAGVTDASTGKGVQVGWVNIAGSMNGLQLGLVNVSDNMKAGGLQIGVVNVIKTGAKFPVLPIINWTF